MPPRSTNSQVPLQIMEVFISFLRLPVSVVPGLRWPVSFVWYRAAGRWLGCIAAAAARCGAPYLHLYFHPWEAIDVRAYGAPNWIAVRTGSRFVVALDGLLTWSASRLQSRTAADFCRTFAPLPERGP